MGSATAYTAEKMEELADANVVGGAVVGDDLVLERRDTTTFIAGNVRGATGPSGGAFVICTSGTRPSGGALFDGLAIYETDTKRIYVYNATTTSWVYRGGLWICTSGTRPASPFTGLEIYETDTKRKYIWDGAAWYFITGAYICTAATRPASPYEGMEIYETDTDRSYIYNGSAWRFVKHLANEDKIEVAYIPGTTAATTGGSMADWLNAGNYTVPSWAARARVAGSLAGIYDVTTANHTYGLRLLIGTDASPQVNVQGVGVGTRFSVPFNAVITLTSTGAKAFKVQAARLGGANNITTDASCLLSALIEFLP